MHHALWLCRRTLTLQMQQARPPDVLALGSPCSMPRASCCVLVLSLLLVLVLVLSLLRVLGLVLVLLLLQEGEAYSVRELLYALMLPSGNDAALVLVRPSAPHHRLPQAGRSGRIGSTVH